MRKEEDEERKGNKDIEIVISKVEWKEDKDRFFPRLRNCIL